MDKSEVERIFRWRKSLVNNFDKITGAIKSAAKADLSSEGQLDIFSMGMEDDIERPKIEMYDGPINLMEGLHLEVELLGLPVTYNPLDDLWMYEELYCTHKVVDLFEMNKNRTKIIVMDRITDIKTQPSKRGNLYSKIFLSNLGLNNYCFLFGDDLKNYISRIFIDQIYLIELEYKLPSPEFSKESIIIHHIKNIKDVDIEAEYERVIKTLKTTAETNEPWQIKNRKK